jgi:hypothetical protein
MIVGVIRSIREFSRISSTKDSSLIFSIGLDITLAHLHYSQPG